MATFNIPGRLIVAGADRRSPENAQPGANFRSAKVQMVDTNNQWDTTTGKVIRWGFMHSEDGGATWEWGPVTQEDPGGLPFGSHDRSGGMPALTIESTDLIGLGTTRLALGINVDTNIRLGATVTVPAP